MQSEFYNVALDQIRYSLVWEDSQTLYEALDINSNDHLLVVTSAGCNVLNTLLKNPASVTAVDLNPLQNKLLLLKKHIIQHHDFTVYKSLLGLAGRDAVSTAKNELIKTLADKDKNFWSGFFDIHPEGILTSGRLEQYITGFYNTLSRDVQQRLRELITFEDVQEQHDHFIKYLHNGSFKQLFTLYFDDENLSKGRDVKLLKYAVEKGGQAFYNRLAEQVRTGLISDNFYFRFFFFGPENLPEDILPPCYREVHYCDLQEQLSKLTIVTSEAIDFLLTDAGQSITKASLSNIFEYTSSSEFDNACHTLANKSNKRLRVVFWNLLNTQGEDPGNMADTLLITKLKASPQSCFYFKNVIRMQKVFVESFNPLFVP